jgi:hypothetical protein
LLFLLIPRDPYYDDSDSSGGERSHGPDGDDEDNYGEDNSSDYGEGTRRRNARVKRKPTPKKEPEGRKVGELEDVLYSSCFSYLVSFSFYSVLFNLCLLNRFLPLEAFTSRQED